MTEIDTVPVELTDRSYKILIGDGVLSQAGMLLNDVIQNSKLIVVTDEIIADLHLEMLRSSLRDADLEFKTIILPSGEKTKNFEHLEKLLDQLIMLGIDRSTTLIAFGGGVIGDLTGFAAAIALRGVDYIQIPTTLLAQVDSSVGGKTAIDTKHGKNLIGAFHQPRLVLSDMEVLNTLPHRQLLAGYAEIAKCALIDDADFFSWLECNGSTLIGGDTKSRRLAISKSCQAKARIVAEDEREANRRALLNLGHTFGHALEAEIDYDDILLHGEAVAIGIALAFRLSVALGVCPKSDEIRVVNHFSNIGLKTSLIGFGQGINWVPERILGQMSKDKKVHLGRKIFILARSIGNAFLSRDVNDKDVLAVLAEALTK